MKIPTPKVTDGETYIGAVADQHGNLHHIILLPGDNDCADWETQMAWAKSIGGDLPSKTELAMLWGTSRGQFQQEWYWSNQEHEQWDGIAVYQSFDGGRQGAIPTRAELRARAVRRMPTH